MGSIRAILDTNDKTVFPQTVPSAVTLNNGLNLQSVLDSLVHVGEKGVYDNFGDTDLSINPKTMENMDIGNTRVNFESISELKDITSGDKTKDIISNLPILINEVKTLRDKINNPNLLINSNFKNPVNQRELTTYNLLKQDDDPTETVQTRTVDMWRINAFMSKRGQNSKLTLNDGYITVHIDTRAVEPGKNVAATAFFQYMENPEMYNHATYTITIKYRLPKGKAFIYYHAFDEDMENIGVYCPLPISRDWNIQSFTYTIDSEKELITFCPASIQINDEGNGIDSNDIDIEYIKLERSSVPTNYCPRPYYEELKLCQRYFYRLKGFDEEHSFYLYGIKSAAGNIHSIVNFPVEMYTLPSYTLCPNVPTDPNDENAFVVENHTLGTKVVTELHITSGCTRNTLLSLTVDNGGQELPDVPYIFKLKGNSYIDFDADI